jgi:hypothetical protein
VSAWEEYVDAARQLDAVRRATAATVAEETAAAHAAREELGAVRARLVSQRTRLLDSASQAGLRPPDVTATAAQVDATAGALRAPSVPVATLAALRQARTVLDAADTELTAASESRGPLAEVLGWPPVVRNLLVYGPLALLVVLVQLVLFAAASGTAPSGLAALCGLVLPVVAYAVGWLTIGLVYPAGASGKVDRTPIVGAAVCLAPMLLACIGFGTLAILR